jgi:hypothetical protein
VTCPWSHNQQLAEAEFELGPVNKLVQLPAEVIHSSEELTLATVVCGPQLKPPNTWELFDKCSSSLQISLACLILDSWVT